MSKKIFFLVLSIVVVITVAIGTTYSMIVSLGETVKASDPVNYTSGNLDINNSGESLTINANLAPKKDIDGILADSNNKITITNTGNLPYVFNVNFSLESNQDINSKYVKVKINDYMPFSLNTLIGDVKNDDLSTYGKKILQNNFLLPGESMEFNLSLWLDSDAPNTIIGKSLKLKVFAQGFSNSSYKDSTPGELGGSGSEQDPYLIESIEDLIKFRDNVNAGDNYSNKFVKLATNLSFKSPMSYSNLECLTEEGYKFGGTCIEISSFLPIGKDANTVFSGTFDGDNHVISNIPYDITNVATGSLYSLSGNVSLVGLFGHVSNANIKNLTVAGNINIDNNNQNYYVGGIVGYLNGGSISNCINKANISLKTSNASVAELSLGGLVGMANNTKADINNVYNFGKITLNGGNNHIEKGNVAGVVGQLVGTISKSYNFGMINGVEANGVDFSGVAAGIFGKIFNGTNLSNYGFIRVEGTSNYIGGVISYGYGDYTDLNNYGMIYSESEQMTVGGVIGNCPYESAKISNLTNYADISIASVSNLAGVIAEKFIPGSVISSMNNLINYGDITCLGSSSFVGGVASNIVSNITNSGNYGNIRLGTTNYVGGIVGSAGDEDNSVYVENSYNVGDIIINGINIDSHIGGISGVSNIVRKSYNGGKISVNDNKADATSYVAGINADGNIENSYNVGDISVSNGDYVGGIAADQCNISNSYSIGRISADNARFAGGIVGNIKNSKLTNTYYLSSSASKAGSATDESTVSYANPYSTEAYMISSQFLGVLNGNSGTIWKQDAKINNGFPYIAVLESVS